MSCVTVRPARPADHPALAELTVAAYRATGRASPGIPYESELADVDSRAAAGRAARRRGGADRAGGRRGAVRAARQRVRGDPRPGEAEFRMLAVHRKPSGEESARRWCGPAWPARPTRLPRGGDPARDFAHGRLHRRLTTSPLLGFRADLPARAAGPAPGRVTADGPPGTGPGRPDRVGGPTPGDRARGGAIDRFDRG